MDRGRAPVFLEVRGEEAERDCEPKEPPAFGLSDDLKFSARYLRPSEKEDPGDPAVAQWMDGIEMGHRAHRGSVCALARARHSGKRATLFNLLLGLTRVRGGSPP